MYSQIAYSEEYAQYKVLIATVTFKVSESQLLKNERIVDLMNYYMVSLEAQVDVQWSRIRLRETA